MTAPPGPPPPAPFAAGWHGKLPALGDFATRRLDAGFVRPWDAWLAEGLSRLLARPGGHDAYLHGPVWRFALGAGVLPARTGLLPLRRGPQPPCWTGVLMPSVDRVGRFYPLTIAHPLDALPPAGPAAAALDGWLVALARTAVAALHDDWTVEALDAALVRLGRPAPGRERSDAAGGDRAGLGGGRAGPAGGGAAESAGGDAATVPVPPAGLEPGDAGAVPWRGTAAGLAFWQPDGDGWQGVPWRASAGLAAGLAAELLGLGAAPAAASGHPAASFVSDPTSTPAR